MTVLETHNDPALAAEIRALAKAKNAVILDTTTNGPRSRMSRIMSAIRWVSRVKRRARTRM